MRTREEIDAALTSVTDELIMTLRELADMAPDGKWTPKHHGEHLLTATKATTKGLKMSRVQLKLLFGKANRPSRSYDELVARYRQKLADIGPVNNNPFPPSSDGIDREELISMIQKETDRLRKVATKWNEQDLDRFILPHPLLGKVTLREMLMFTLYHIQHHMQVMHDQASAL